MSAFERITHQVGRRGACLLALAVAQICIGWTNLTFTPATIAQLTLFREVPIVILGLWWLIPAAIGLVAVVYDRLDGVSFYLSYIAMFTWAFIYATAVWPFGDLPAGIGMRTAGIFWAISLLILAIAGWQENLPAATIPPIPLHGPDDLRSGE